MSLDFLVPLPVVESGKLKTLRDVREAIAFLETWPQAERDTMWIWALRRCEFVRDGLLGASSARRAVESWAKQNSVLGFFADVYGPGATDRLKVMMRSASS